MGSDDSSEQGGQFLVYVDRTSGTDDDNGGSPAQTEVIVSNAGGTKGDPYDPASSQNFWNQATTYQFSITYTTDFVIVSIDGTKVLEMTPDDVGLSQFKGGRFGFSNASQPDITYGNVQFANASVEEAAPIAEDDDRYGIDLATEGLTLNIDRFDGLLFNDFDPDGDEINIVIDGTELTGSQSASFVTANNASVTVNNDGSFDYTANSGFEGEDTFTYRLRDSDGNLSDQATVTITVINDNLDPTSISINRCGYWNHTGRGLRRFGARYPRSEHRRGRSEQ
ncbi:MAG: Ig-like domain-containing protein [Halioglobus sp.]|nr:Ig-like domain-containing protein [Halioglobus sp.]